MLGLSCSMQAFSSCSAQASLFPACGLSCPTCEVLVSLTRNQTCIPCIARQILNHWTTREVHQIVNNNYHSLSPYSNWHCAKHYDYIISKAMVFPMVMYECESWTIKKAECQRTDAFKLWCWRRFLGVPWTARRSNQWVLKEISPEYSLEGLMLTLKLQYFGHLIWNTASLEKTLRMGKIEGRKRRGW